MIISSLSATKKWALKRARKGAMQALCIAAFTVATFVPAHKTFANAETLEVGFAQESITPAIDDPNEPIWIAGFGQNRKAESVHDNLWARAVALSDGNTRGVILALDAIGFMHNDVMDIRRMVKDLNLDFVVITSTHDHEAPDLIGIWGPSLFKSGVNQKYLDMVKSQSAIAVRTAVAKLEPAFVMRAEIPNVGRDVLVDTRLPEVFDANVRYLRFMSASSNQTLGTLVTWANHPEVLWNANTAITSDFVHYLREGIESGIEYNSTVIKSGIGGTVVFANGAVGGLMTTLDDTPVVDRVLNQVLLTPSFEKARTVGYRVATAVLNTVDTQAEVQMTAPALHWRSRSILLPVDNVKFRLAALLRIIRRKFEKGFKTRSEVGLLQLGDTWIGTIPGELYPEIADGGIETPEGNDFKLTKPIEVPALRTIMKGKMNMLFGLANDQIGYIIPKSQWDEKAPYTYNDKPYGEENSLGPQTAPLIHDALSSLLREASEAELPSPF
ncbi:MAG: hypothetical protein RJB13_494 [Pseudomonadota bacterium]